MKKLITSRMSICKGGHCLRECVEVTNCVMMNECSGRKKDGKLLILKQCLIWNHCYRSL